MRENYLKSFSLLATIFLLAGSCYIYFYYNYFGVNIFHFIKLDELANLLGQGAIVSVSTFVVLLILYILFAIFEFIFFAIKNRKELHNMRLIEFELFQSKTRSNIAFFFILVILIVVGFSLNRISKTNEILFYDYLAITAVFTVFILSMSQLLVQGRELREEIQSNPRLRGNIFALTSLVPLYIQVSDIEILSKTLILAVAFSFFGHYNANKSLNTVTDQEVILTSEDRTVSSDSTRYFIGKSSDYYFFYEIRDKYPIIYSKDLKQKIVMK